MLLADKCLAIILCANAISWAQSSGDHSPQARQNSSQPSTPPAVESKPVPESADSTRLEPIKTSKAVYPIQALEKRLQGQVWLRIGVSETGDVDGIEVISGDPLLAAAAVDAARKWKFKPFIKNGKPTAVFTKVPFDFAFSENVRDEKALPQTPTGRITVPAAFSTPNSAPAPGVPQRVRISQGVTAGLLSHKVAPVYPPEAATHRRYGATASNNWEGWQSQGVEADLRS